MGRIISTLILLIFTTSSIAQIGISNIEFNDQSRNRSIDTFIFYPTSQTLNKIFAENMAFHGFSAAQDSPVSKEKLPLYILVHGTAGNWKNTSWLAREPAEDAIVVSANFPDYTTDQATPESVLKPWNQVKDVSFLIDAVSTSEYGKSIDRDRIAVIGLSLGGYTAMAVSGVTIDLKKYQAFCKINSDKSCGYFEEALNKLSDTDIASAKQSLYDNRVKAGIAMAPGFTESMSQDSLTSSSTPMFIISAENDLNVPPKTHLINIPANIEQYQIKKASHFSFLQLCKPDAISILSEEGVAFVCEDSSDKGRPEIHRETVQQIKYFLAKHGL